MYIYILCNVYSVCGWFGPKSESTSNVRLRKDKAARGAAQCDKGESDSSELKFLEQSPERKARFFFMTKQCFNMFQQFFLLNF